MIITLTIQKKQTKSTSEVNVKISCQLLSGDFHMVNLIIANSLTKKQSLNRIR